MYTEYLCMRDTHTYYMYVAVVVATWALQLTSQHYFVACFVTQRKAQQRLEICITFGFHYNFAM